MGDDTAGDDMLLIVQDTLGRLPFPHQLDSCSIESGFRWQWAAVEHRWRGPGTVGTGVGESQHVTRG